MAIMPILASDASFRENWIFQLQNATLVSIEPLDLWFQVQHAPLYTNLAFACKTDTLSSLYSHALFDSNWIIQVQTSSGAWTEV